MDHFDMLELFDDYQDDELAHAANLLHEQALTLAKGGYEAASYEKHALAFAATVVLFARKGANQTDGITNS